MLNSFYSLFLWIIHPFALHAELYNRRSFQEKVKYYNHRFCCNSLRRTFLLIWIVQLFFLINILALSFLTGKEYFLNTLYVLISMPFIIILKMAYSYLIFYLAINLLKLDQRSLKESVVSTASSQIFYFIPYLEMVYFFILSWAAMSKNMQAHNAQIFMIMILFFTFPLLVNIYIFYLLGGLPLLN